MKKSIASLIYILVGLTFLIFYSCNSKNEQAQGKGKMTGKVITVDGVVLSPQKLVEAISVSGTVKSYEEVELTSEISGRVTKLNINEGQFVKSGTLLVKFYDDDLQANLKKTQSQLAIQQDIFDRQSELMKIEGISKNDYEQSKLQIASLKSDIEYQKAMIRKTEVLAPFDGIVGLRDISIGAHVSPGTILTTFRSKDKLKLDFSVPEKYANEISNGMKVDFTLTNSETKYTAKVIATEMSINEGTRNYKVRALVDQKSPKLISGSFASVNLDLGENTKAMMIPSQAIIPSARNKSVIISQNGKAIFKPIVTGIRKSDLVEVKEGLSFGDTILTSGLLFLKDGDPVKFSSVKNQ